jgi:predicted ATP-dependent endonuclease of OLD family
VRNLISEVLPADDERNIAVSYRALKDRFSSDAKIHSINEKLSERSEEITEKTLSIGLDVSSRSSWDTVLSPHLDGVPLSLAGKGEQNSIKIKIALVGTSDFLLILIEEPENHLSHVNLNKLINAIGAAHSSKQILITTHSTFVMNKLGLHNTIFVSRDGSATLSDLSNDTRRYFMRLPGHDTLRYILSRRTILVEGPSDELIILLAFRMKYGISPLEKGVEVISLNSLAFKRFLEIGRVLSLNVVVVTDNDGKPQNKRLDYKSFIDFASAKFCMSDDASLVTLENHIIANNDITKLNAIFSTAYETESELLNFMKKNKAEWALYALESDEDIVLPEYIIDAIEE